ncbi:MAG TPA: HD domain-containing protein [Clostridiaceae bacterium]|jgi:putative hydrolase of HD superfamily|nr:HD domain-containing protein [Clostridiaceae bacterium]
MDKDRFQKQLDFIVEIDRLKTVLRQSAIIDQSKRENSAEHSWHIAIMGTILYEYCDTDKVDLARAVKMALIHDIVEVYAGDTFAFDIEGYKDKQKREKEAADKIFGMLPENQGTELRELWEEFEAMETYDAKFAAAMDRLQPFILNYYTEGHTWKLGNVNSAMVYKRIGVLREACPDLWNNIDEMIKDSIEKGYLKE